MSDLCMCSLCRERAEAYCRVAAFGAIRRAAEMVRGWEVDAENVRNLRDNAEWWESAIIGRSRENLLLQAASARVLIRVAIGSDKA